MEQTKPETDIFQSLPKNTKRVGDAALNHTKSSIMITLAAIMQKGKKHYATASIDAIRELLKKYHGANIGRRWTFQCFRNLVNNKLIARQSRYVQGEENAIRQIPSMYAFTLKGLKWLVSKKVEGAKELLAQMIAWLKNKDTRFPRARPTIRDSAPLENEENLKRLKRLILPIG